MSCKSCGSNGLTEEQKKILAALAEKGEPSGCKDIAQAIGLSSQAVSCRLRSLKSKGYVESPAKGKYVITETGRAQVGA
ncbi:LexA family protein [Thermosulfuriphilus sp.]